MKTLLVAKSVVEVLAGIGLALFPSELILLLLGTQAVSAKQILLARIAGLVLLALGIACWRVRNQQGSRAATWLLAALLCYDVLVAVGLLLARFGAGLTGLALWPAILLHSCLAVWSVTVIGKNSQTGPRP